MKAWEKVDVALTGEMIPHEAAWGMSRFDYLKANPDQARLFDAMMAHFPDGRHEAIAAAYDFSGARLIADIGGGDGATLRHILTRFPTPSGLLFEREDVIRSTLTATCASAAASRFGATKTMRFIFGLPSKRATCCGRVRSI